MQLNQVSRLLTSIVVIWIAGLLPAVADNDIGTRLAAAARMQVGKTIRYDPGYCSIGYPNGDVPMDRGVCSDVVVRAFRAGLGMDLQRLVHEDMKRNFGRYPHDWGLGSPDKNIDHRRVANLQTYFNRRGWSIVVTEQARDYKAGDLVTCIVPPNLPHIMIVSDKRTVSGRPLVIHNIGQGTKEEDRLFEFELTAHYRIKQLEHESAASFVEPHR
jgi:uncharacterized protein YijF (DUF1287 family)